MRIDYMKYAPGPSVGSAIGQGLMGIGEVFGGIGDDIRDTRQKEELHDLKTTSYELGNIAKQNEIDFFDDIRDDKARAFQADADSAEANAKKAQHSAGDDALNRQDELEKLRLKTAKLASMGEEDKYYINEVYKKMLSADPDNDGIVTVEEFSKIKTELDENPPEGYKPEHLDFAFAKHRQDLLGSMQKEKEGKPTLKARQGEEAKKMFIRLVNDGYSQEEANRQVSTVYEKNYGLAVTTGADGRPRVTFGTGNDFPDIGLHQTKKNVGDSWSNKLASNNTLLRRVAAAAEMFDEDNVGLWDAPVDYVQSKTTDLEPDEAYFRAAAEFANSIQRHKLFGSALTSNEIKTARGWIPSLTDQPKTFKSKTKNLIDYYSNVVDEKYKSLSPEKKQNFKDEYVLMKKDIALLQGAFQDGSIWGSSRGGGDTKPGQAKRNLYTGDSVPQETKERPPLDQFFETKSGTSQEEPERPPLESFFN